LRIIGLNELVVSYCFQERIQEVIHWKCIEIDSQSWFNSKEGKKNSFEFNKKRV